MDSGNVCTQSSVVALAREYAAVHACDSDAVWYWDYVTVPAEPYVVVHLGSRKVIVAGGIAIDTVWLAKTVFTQRLFMC